MIRDFVNTAILAGFFLSLFGIAEILYHKFYVKAELTRKLVHFGTGILTLLFPVMLGNQWLVLFLCSSFAIIILASIKFNFLNSVNGIERKSYGSICYPISVCGCYFAFNYFLGINNAAQNPYIYYYLPILTLAICDPIAALIGRKYPIGKYKIGKNNKTIVGSLAFTITSVLLSVSILIFLSHGILDYSLIPLVFLIAFITAIVEAISGNGLDNITIPAAVLLLLILFIK